MNTRFKSTTLAFVFGVVFVCVILVIAFFVPHPSNFQYTVFRIVLALAAAGVAAEIPGILNVKIHKVIRGSGALGVFLVVYFYSPANMVVQPENSGTTKTVGAIKNDTDEIKKILIEYVQHQTTSTRAGEGRDDTTREHFFLAELEKKHGLPAGTLITQLPAFAKRLATDGTATAYERANGAFAALDYVEAERLALVAADEARKAIPLDKGKIIKALQLAGWSASQRRQDLKAVAHLTAAAALADKTENPLEWAGVNYALAYALDNRGQYTQAENLLRQVLLIRTEKLGLENPDSLGTLNGLAKALNAQGKYSEAEGEFREIIKISARVLGPEHLDTLTSRNNLTAALLGQSKYAEAEAECRAVIKIEERALGPEHPETLASRSNLAAALYFQSKYADTEAEYRAVIKIEERVLGSEHPETLSGRNNLAATLHSEGMNVEAEAEYRAVKKIQERVLGPEHPDTLKCRSNLANVIRSQSKYAEAEEEYRALIKIEGRVLGPEHPDTLRSLYNLALCLEDEGKVDEAEQLSKRVVNGGEKVLGPEHSDVKDYRKLYQRLALRK